MINIDIIVEQFDKLKLPRFGRRCFVSNEGFFNLNRQAGQCGLTKIITCTKCDAQNSVTVERRVCRLCGTFLGEKTFSEYTFKDIVIQIDLCLEKDQYRGCIGYEPKFEDSKE